MTGVATVRTSFLHSAQQKLNIAYPLSPPHAHMVPFTQTFKHSLLTTHWRLAAPSCRNVFSIQHGSLWKLILDPGTRSDPIGAISDLNKQNQVRVARPSAHVKVADINPV